MAEPLGTGDKDVATHLHSYTNLAALPQTPPLVIVEGDGIHVVDEKGKRYLEAMSGLWCASLGFSNKRLAEAGAKALNTLPYYHTFNQRTNVAVADLACPIGPHTWRSVLRSAHAAQAAAQTVLDGGGIAYALCRPSGHHAQHARAGGFCYLNNSAIAASTLRRRHARVAVLDIDAHHGDGTQQIFYERADVLTVSTHADPSGYYPWYTGYSHERGTGEGEGCNLNLPLAHGSGNAEFAEALGKAVAAIERFQPQALVLPLGFDTYKDDPISVLKFDMEAFRLAGARVRALGLPTVVVQEGGYMVEAIGAALDAFLDGLRA